MCKDGGRRNDQVAEQCKGTLELKKITNLLTPKLNTVNLEDLLAFKQFWRFKSYFYPNFTLKFMGCTFPEWASVILKISINELLLG